MERESPLLSSGESSGSADVGGIATGSSDEAKSAMPNTGTTARVNGGSSGKKKVRFEAAPRIIPHAWFYVLSEGASYPSFEIEEQLREKLQGRTIREVELGEGQHETPTEVDGRQDETAGVAPTGLWQGVGEAAGETPTAVEENGTSEIGMRIETRS